MLNIILENQYLLEHYLHGYTGFSQTFGQLLFREKYFRAHIFLFLFLDIFKSFFKAILLMIL